VDQAGRLLDPRATLSRRRERLAIDISLDALDSAYSSTVGAPAGPGT
jgi:hypothetical protein